MKKLVIWDVDGTLLDTSEGLLSSVRYMIRELGLNSLTDEELRSFVGPRIQDSLQRIYGLEGEKLKTAAAVFREHYKQGDVLVANPYDGIEELLINLKNRGIYQAIATNKRQDFVDALVDKCGYGEYFTHVHGTDLAGKYLKKDLIRFCISDYDGLEDKDAVMIGDSDYDAIAATEAGIDFIGVTYGFDFKKPEDVVGYHPVGVANSVMELSKILTEEERKTWGN